MSDEYDTLPEFIENVRISGKPGYRDELVWNNRKPAWSRQNSCPAPLPRLQSQPLTSHRFNNSFLLKSAEIKQLPRKRSTTSPIMLSERRRERENLKLPLNRSYSEPGTEVLPLNIFPCMKPDEELQEFDENNSSSGTMLVSSRKTKRLHLQLQHHYNQVHLHTTSHRQHQQPSAVSPALFPRTPAPECLSPFFVPSKPTMTTTSITTSSTTLVDTSLSTSLFEAPSVVGHLPQLSVAPKNENIPSLPMESNTVPTAPLSKKCCLGLPVSVSLPSSPCSESASLHRSMLVKKTKIWGVEQLARKLELVQQPMDEDRCRTFLVVDCRPFLSFNVGHIQGAINVNCADRWNRKRLQLGRATLADLATTKEGKDALRKRGIKEVVVYDDGATDCEHLPATSPLYVVLSALLEDNKEPVLLAGGWREFHKHTPQLCQDALTPAPMSSSAFNCSSAGVLSSPQICIPAFSTTPSSPILKSRWELESFPATQILPYLFLGNGRDAASLEILTSLKIGRVLNVTSDLPSYHQNHGIIYKQLPAADSGQQNLRQFFDEACQFIEEARVTQSGVLIHCHAGISRSPTIALAYLMRHTNLSLIEAYSLIKQRRSIISPNLNFMGQLLEFEQSLKSSALSSSSLAPKGVTSPQCRHVTLPGRWTDQSTNDMDAGCFV